MLNIAVVGCGYWGPNVIRNFCHFEGRRAKIAYDVETERLNYIRLVCVGIETTTEFDRVVK